MEAGLKAKASQQLDPQILIPLEGSVSSRLDWSLSSLPPTAPAQGFAGSGSD